MTIWTDILQRERAPGLPTALRKEGDRGQYRFAFLHGDDEITDPSHDPTGQLLVSPRDYGFSIRGFQGGNTAWARDFANGTMLLTSADGQSHALSPRFPARIVFMGLDGVVLQDSGGDRRVSHAFSEHVTLRLTISATVDLNGLTAEAVRGQLVALLDDALDQWAAGGQSAAILVDHAIEQVLVEPDRRASSSDTDFSQLLDL